MNLLMSFVLEYALRYKFISNWKIHYTHSKFIQKKLPKEHVVSKLYTSKGIQKGKNPHITCWLYLRTSPYNVSHLGPVWSFIDYAANVALPTGTDKNHIKQLNHTSMCTGNHRKNFSSFYNYMTI